MENALTVAQINNYPVETYNRLFPATMTEISPLHKIIVNIVKIDPNPDAKDVYKEKNSGGLALTKIGCLKLMTAANVVMENSEPVLPRNCLKCVEVAKATRLAPQCAGCSTKDDVAHKVSILVPEPSGGNRRYTANKEVTKQDTLAKKNSIEHMGGNCETKALLRALRAGLGLKGSYTAQELAKPFAIAVVVLNTQDPDMKKALIARFAAGQDALFGGGTSVALPTGSCLQLNAGAINGEVVVVGPDDDDIPEWEKPENIPQCEVCHKAIEPYEEYTAKMIADNLKAKRGRVICSTCHATTGGIQ